MLEALREDVYKANMLLVQYGLVQFTWGNVSGIDREKGLVVIKPSGVAYDELTPENMVVVDLKGNKIEGALSPSVDMPTHICLYNNFPEIGGIVHTHSKWATIWAQAGRPIPPYGTTHADFAYGPIPCTRELSKLQLETDYELNTGKIIAQFFQENSIDPQAVPAVLVKSHGPFTWGSDCFKAVENAAMLEDIAMMAKHTESLADAHPIEQYLLDKHYLRKHGSNATYGQKTT
ncbi:MAG: L-ribulose-5-phosphate 4-epimerase [Eubacteriales bacterium]